MRLADKITLITGSGSGIGKSTALRFAKEGAVVVVNDLNEENGKQTVQEINNQGGEATFVQADVTDPEMVQQMVAAVIQTYGRIDVLFNNAGISNVGAL